MVKKKIKTRNHRRSNTVGGSITHLEKPKDPFSVKFDEVVATCPANIIKKVINKPLPYGEYPQPVFSPQYGQGASYHGFFAKTFKASSKDGNYRGKSELTVKDFQYAAREFDNQLGRDPCHEQQIVHVPSPVNLDLQEDRKAWSKYGILGPVYGCHGYLNENRFIANPLDISEVNSKYRSFLP